MPPARVLNGYVVRRQPSTKQRQQASLPCFATSQPANQPPIRRISTWVRRRLRTKPGPARTATTSSACDRPGHFDSSLVSFRLELACFCIRVPDRRHSCKTSTSCPASRTSRPPSKKGAVTRAGSPAISYCLCSSQPRLVYKQFGLWRAAASEHISTAFSLRQVEPVPGQNHHHQPTWPVSSSSRFTPRWVACLRERGLPQVLPRASNNTRLTSWLPVTVVHCPMGQSRRGPHNLMECPAAQEVHVSLSWYSSSCPCSWLSDTMLITSIWTAATLESSSTPAAAAPISPSTSPRKRPMHSMAPPRAARRASSQRRTRATPRNS